MADGLYNEPRKWSLEEIDELLRDSGIVTDAKEDEKAPEPVSQKKAESVDPRPTYNENAEHKIKTKNVEKSDADKKTRVFGTLESDKYRERFLNRPVQNLEKTAEHAIVSETEPYERGGFIKREGVFKNTVELQPIPTIVSDELLGEEQALADGNTRTVGLRSLAVTNGNAHETELPDEDDSQLTFEGFNEGADVPVVDEAEVEEELLKKRREKAAEFVLSNEISDSTDDSDSGRYGIDEYRSVNDKFKVSYFLKKKRTSALFGTAAGGVCVLILLLLSLIASASKVNPIVLLSLNIILSAVSLVACRNNFADGLKGAFTFKFNRNSGAALAALVSVIYGVVLFFKTSPFESGLHLYSAAALLPLTLCSAADFLEYGRIKKNFSKISENELYSVGDIDKEDTAFEIGRGLLLDDPQILSSQKTLFPGRFLECSSKYYPSDDVNKRTVPIVFAASFIIAALTLLLSKDIFYSVAALSASLCVGVPYSSFISDALSIGKATKTLNSRGGIISGWESYRECSQSNAVAVDANDIFDGQSGNIHGIRTYHSMSPDEAILDTAALTVASNGPLGELFKRVVLGRTELLPEADTLVYEDKLGLSAWLRNRRVLVGSEDLLRNHNVEVPEKSTYSALLHDGRYPLFLAIEGKLAAMFIVSYGVNEKNAERLRAIEKSGLSILVRSDDANITDEMLAAALGVPQSGIKVLSAVSSDILNTYKKEVRSAAKASLMHGEREGSFLECVKSALSLGKAKHLTGIIQAGACGVGVAIVASLALVSGISTLSCAQLVITQLVFTAISSVAARLK